MRSLKRFMVAGVMLLLGIGSGTAAEPPGVVVKMASVPPPALAVIKSEVAGGKISRITRTAAIGYYVLEVDYFKGNVERSISVSTLGRLLERDVFLAEVPAPVQKAIQSQTAGGKLGDITWMDDEGEIFYYVEFEQGGAKKAVSLSPDGKLLSVQVTLAETPAATQKTIKDKVGDGTIEDIDKSVEDGYTTFDVTYFKKGRGTREFTVDEDGDLISDQVSRAETPEAVQQTVREQVGIDRFKRIDKVDDDGEKYYRIEVIRIGKKMAFKVGVDGKYLGSTE